MLRSLYINNIAIISQLGAEFFPGMTSVTGETGAGKSIVIDALTLALGKRADKEQLKHGADKAEVIAEFDIGDHPGVQAWLAKQELDTGEHECVLRRNLYPDRPSRSFINDRPVTAQVLSQLGEQLVNFCGQQEHLSLVNPAHRLDIVDRHAGTEENLSRLGKCFQEVTAIHARIEELEQADSQGVDQVDMLTFLIKELEQGEFSEQDYGQVDQEQKRLAHATDIASAVNISIELLNSPDQQNVLGMLNQAISQLTSVCKFDTRLDCAIEALAQSSVVCDDAASELATIAGKLDVEPQRQDEVDTRLASYHQLARKHRCEPVELEQKLKALRNKLDEIANRDNILKDFKDKHARALKQYYQIAGKISQQRARSATSLSKAVSSHLKALNLPHAVCEFECSTNTSRISPNGQDNIRILVSTNRGQPPGPVEKIASGGELSRISLAIQLETARLAHTPVLVFDEVDAGISGKTADLVGIKLKELGGHCQVICITHLPQVASKARHQLKVSKLTEGSSMVELDYLDAQARIEELARILSGRNITRESMANARVMLQDSA